MKRFTQLFTELDETNRTNEKVAALESYFREAAASGCRMGTLPHRTKAIAHITSTTCGIGLTRKRGLPLWMMDECYEVVGDFAETLALLLPGRFEHGAAAARRGRATAASDAPYPDAAGNCCVKRGGSSIARGSLSGTN